MPKRIYLTTPPQKSQRHTEDRNRITRRDNVCLHALNI